MSRRLARSPRQREAPTQSVAAECIAASLLAQARTAPTRRGMRREQSRAVWAHARSAWRRTLSSCSSSPYSESGQRAWRCVRRRRRCGLSAQRAPAQGRVRFLRRRAQRNRRRRRGKAFRRASSRRKWGGRSAFAPLRRGSTLARASWRGCRGSSSHTVSGEHRDTSKEPKKLFGFFGRTNSLRARRIAECSP